MDLSFEVDENKKGSSHEAIMKSRVDSAVRVLVSGPVLSGIVLAAVEAYKYGDWKRPATSLETAGELWGFKRETETGVTLCVAFGTVSLSAARTRWSVRRKADATKIKAKLLEDLAPQLTLLGDYHSHPYADRQSVLDRDGFEFTPADYQSFFSDDLIWQTAGGHPLMLAITVCKLRRREKASGIDRLRPDLMRFDLDGFRLWISAAAGFQTGGKRCCTSHEVGDLSLELTSAL